MNEHRTTFKQCAADAYIASTTHLQPDSTDLQATSDLLAQSKQHLTNLLEPILNKISPKTVDTRLQKIKTAVADNYKRLEKQLTDIPDLRKELDTLEEKMMGAFDRESNALSSIKTKKENINDFEKKLNIIRDNSFDKKMLRRFDLGYQLDRGKLQEQKKIVEGEIRALIGKKETAKEELSQHTKNHTETQIVLEHSRTTYINQDAIVDTGNVLERERSAPGPIEGILLSSLTKGKTLETDLALARKFFKSKTSAFIPDNQKMIATVFNHLVSSDNQLNSTHDALLILDQVISQCFKDGTGLNSKVQQLLESQNPKTFNFTTLPPKSSGADDATTAKTETSIPINPNNNENNYNSLPLSQNLEEVLTDFLEFDNITQEQSDKVYNYFTTLLEGSPDLEAPISEMVNVFYRIIDVGWDFDNSFSSIKAGVETFRAPSDPESRIHVASEAAFDFLKNIAAENTSINSDTEEFPPPPPPLQSAELPLATQSETVAPAAKTEKVATAAKSSLLASIQGFDRVNGLKKSNPERSETPPVSDDTNLESAKTEATPKRKASMSHADEIKAKVEKRRK